MNQTGSVVLGDGKEEVIRLPISRCQTGYRFAVDLKCLMVSDGTKMDQVTQTRRFFRTSDTLSIPFYYPMGSMVLVYMLTLGDIDGIHVTI